ncbi:MAG: hypothetical protein ACTSWY_04395 [Promethearchaeota archaeon]
MKNLYTIVPVNYPNRILLGTESYNLIFKATNHGNSTEKFQINFSSEGLNIEIPKEIKKPIEIGASQTKEIAVNITPNINGNAKIIIQTIHNKMEQYTELVWKVKKLISSSDEIIQDGLSRTFFSGFDLLKPEFRLPTSYTGSTSIITVKQAKMKIKNIDNSSELTPDKYTNQTIEPQIIKPITEKKDQRLQKIAKNVFNSNMEFAFKIMDQINDLEIRQSLLGEFIPPYAGNNIDNLKDVLSKFSLIKDGTVKDVLLKKIICGIALENTEKAISMAENLIDPDVREEIFENLIGIYQKINIDDSLKLIGKKIKNVSTQLNLFMEMIKLLYNSDKKKCIKIIDETIKKSIDIKNISFLKYLIAFIGALQDPQTAINVIEDLPEDINQVISKELHRTLNEQIEEQRTRVEQIPVDSIFYTFNCILKPSRSYELVAKLEGNISENLLLGELRSSIGLISLFGFDFPLFPTIERCYTEIKSEKQKSFYYMIIPTKNRLKEDFSFIEIILNEIFVKKEDLFNNKVYIFNIDFIPHLSKPTIILGSDSEENQVIKSIVNRIYGNSVSFLIDSGLFQGGFVFELLKKTLPVSSFKVLNLVMTYDFLNDYKMFKKFMNEFIK